MPPKRQAKTKAAATNSAAASKPAKTTAKATTKTTTKATGAAPAKAKTAGATKATKPAATKAAPKPAPKPKAASKKRKIESEDEKSPEPEEARPAKRTKAAAAAPSKRQRVAKSPTPKPEKKALPVINTAPTRVLEVFAFGNGENGELGLGPSKTEALVPRRNLFLDPRDTEKYQVVQIDCGGMHTIALTDDNKVVTWGVNDKGALGRDTAWEGGLRDADASDSEDEEAELNPKESTPIDIPASAFPEGTRFVQVAAGDSCSFALTDTGLVYGWGTFLVCSSFLCPPLTVSNRYCSVE